MAADVTVTLHVGSAGSLLVPDPPPAPVTVSRPPSPPVPPGSLPFTGIDAISLVALALMLVVLGLLARLAPRHPDPAA